jgi:hypothetical protein
MSINRKFVIAGVVVAAIAGTSAYAVAHPRHGFGRGAGDCEGGMGRGMGMGPGGGPGMMGGPRGPGMGWQSPDARLAAAKAEIGIKPEQTAAWDAYAKLVTDTAAEMRRNREQIDRDALRAMKPEDRQTHRDAMMKQRDEAFAKVKAAAEKLAAELDDTQKAKARENLPGLAENGFGAGPRHGMAGGPRWGRGGGHGMGPGWGMGPRW